MVHLHLTETHQWGFLSMQMFFYICNKVEIAKVVIIIKSKSMKRADLILFNEESMRKLKSAGIRLDDYKYADMWRDYAEMIKTATSRKVVILSLSEKYRITDRQVYNIIKYLEKKIEQ